jgi:hypothetical protein
LEAGKMNIDQLITLNQTPSQLNSVSLEELEEIVDTYPFFALGRLLLTKKMQQTQHLQLKKEIKKTAVTIPFRKKLYQFLYQKELQHTILKTETYHDEKIEYSTSINEETSSFSSPVEMKAAEKPAFSQPIDLKSLGQKKSKEIDFLEQQIIGHTIEHVLSQEIKEQNDIIEPKETHVTSSSDIKQSQKFSDWLSILDHDRFKNSRNEPVTSNNTDEVSEKSIIDSFLQNDINIITPTSEESDFSPSNLARLSVVDDEEFVTETLANIYAKQGNLDKALKAYKNLLLKYPEKKTYFAARIEEIEKDLK